MLFHLLKTSFKGLWVINHLGSALYPTAKPLGHLDIRIFQNYYENCNLTHKLWSTYVHSKNTPIQHSLNSQYRLPQGKTNLITYCINECSYTYNIYRKVSFTKSSILHHSQLFVRFCSCTSWISTCKMNSCA